jgi:long-chain acyl-CoA synthetase
MTAGSSDGGPLNAADFLRRSAEDDARVGGGRSAIVFQGRPLSFEELDDRVDATAAALAGLGVRAGDRVALLAGNVPEFVFGLYGSWRIGAIACPLNVMLTGEEIGYILADCGAKVAISELATLAALLSARERSPHLETIVVIGGPPAPAGTVSLEEALGAEGELPAVETRSSDVAVVAYTAGTTAAPKGAMLTHGNLVSNLEQLSAVPRLVPTEDDVTLLALPVFHIYGLNALLGLGIKGGASSVLVERFDPAETLDLVERHGITILAGAPPMFSAWLHSAGSDVRSRLATVRLAVSGASALSPAVFEAFRDRLGVTISEGYGLTEAGPVVSSNAVGPQAKAGSIGLPLPGVDVRLLDEDGDVVEEGDPGEIHVRGPNVFAGYWNRPDASAEVLEGEWLKTGDVAYEDDEGYLFLVDRKKDLIIVSGFNVFPKEVEDAIETHPAVEEAAVVGIADEKTGEAVQAWVVPVSGQELTEDDVLKYVQDHLGRFKWPKEVHVVDELPHHVTGKVLRRALRGEDILGEAGSIPEESSAEERTQDGGS